jgi:hypothetical protein
MALLIDRQAWFGFLVTLVAVLLLFRGGESDKAIGLLSSNISNIWALSYAAIIYLLWGVINSACKVKEEEGKLGAWHGNRFIYHEPLHVKTTVITPGMEEDYFDVVFEDAEPNTLVSFLVRFDERNGRVKVLADFPALQKTQFMWEMYTPKLRQSLRVKKDRKIRLFFKIEPETDPTTIMVYMLHWEI